MKPENYKVYKKPTVKVVIFQIKYSDLFIIENRIGEFQSKIIKKFPDSSFIMRRELLFADVGPEFKMEQIPLKEPIGRKIWRFTSNEDYELNVLTNSLDITSKQHKSYYKYDDKDGFRDIIEFVMNHFLDIIPLEIIKRIGLRYIDEAPIPSLEAIEFKKWYNTTFPLHRFKLDEVGKMVFQALNVKRDRYKLNYIETLQYEKDEKTSEPKLKYYLDFDGYAENITKDDYLKVLDDLHNLIHNEWSKNTIKDPVKEWMEKGGKMND
ncbi:MAG: TIGR04255 family protein [Promethearchaeota archaeon]